ncbi:MAG: LysR family transcriptional regulator [Pseudomonadota bacterium]
MNTDQLRTFVTIAELGNLTAAAARLHKTQSAISAQLKNLETGLGVALFARAARGMMLTDQGERFLPHAKSVIRDLGALSAMFDQPLSGAIRVGVPDDFEDGRLEQLLGRFAQEHPGVEVRVTSGCSQDFQQAVQRNELDVAVSSGPAYGDGEPLYEENIVWVSARHRVDPPAGLVPLALLDRTCWWRSVAQTALERAGRPYRIAFSSSSFASVCAAICSGLAVGIVPERVVKAEMRVLGAKGGFPALPIVRRTILTREGAPPDLVNAMKRSLISLAAQAPERAA